MKKILHRIMLLGAAISMPLWLMAQDLNVSGTVTDGNGDPVVGASVVVKGTTIGATTGINGEYDISAPPDATLVFSFLGMGTMEEAVLGKARIDVVLGGSDQAIEEVVVVGYGSVKRSNLTGSVSTVNAQKIENRAAPNLSTTLTGLAAGVTVRQSSGEPGNDGANIRIRGTGTFSSSYRAPMVIIDGIEGNMNSVNPNDVASISILKDASSAAIYGSRAANGVILVTTKKGKPDAAPTVTYSGLFSMDQVSSKFEFLHDHGEYMDLMNLAQKATNPSAALPYSQAQIDEYRAAAGNPNGDSRYIVDGVAVPNFLAYPNTNWADIVFQNKFAQNHNVSVTGGSGNTNYAMSLGYVTNPGTFENTGLDRYQMRVNVDTRINKFLKVGTQTFASLTSKQVGNFNSALTYLYQCIAGIYPYYDGKYGGRQVPQDDLTSNNMLRLLKGNDGLERQIRLNTTWFAKVNFTDWLWFDANVNFQTYQMNREDHSTPIRRYDFRTGKYIDDAPVPSASSTTVSRQYAEEYKPTGNLLLNFSKTFAGDHSIDALLGTEQLYYNWRSLQAQKSGLMEFSIYDIQSAAEMYAIGGDPEQDYAMLSFFGRINYAYRQKYFLQANFRSDASSRFSPDNRWGMFPSFSAKWRITEEGFADAIKGIVPELALRAAWGKLGNTTSGYYDWQEAYGKQNNSVGGSIANGLAVTKVANPALHWENITSTDIAVEAGFLKKRLLVEAGYYNKLTEGILTSPAIYSTMGIVGAPTKNTSDMRNRGIELSLTWADKVSDFQYSATLNFAWNKNEVVKYLGKLKQGWETDAKGEPVYKTNIGDVSNNGDNMVVEDHPYNEYFLRQVYSGSGSYYGSDGAVDINGGPRDGMIRTPEDLQWVKDMIDAGYSFNGTKTISNTGLNYGELIYADLNGDKNYGNSYDRAFTGKSDNPAYMLGFTASAAWNGIDLQMTWAGNFGMWYYLRERGINQNNFSAKGNAIPLNAREMFYYYNAADPDDPNNNINAEYPRMLLASNGTYQTSNFYLYDASYFKLKYLTIGYTLPQKWMNMAHIKSLRVFVSGENLLTFTKYPGIDPEVGSAVNQYPIAKVFSGGLTITF